MRRIRALKRAFLSEERGQTVAEYGLLMWFFAFAGTVALVTFFFAFEQAVLGFYEDVVNVIALPLP